MCALGGSLFPHSEPLEEISASSMVVRNESLWRQFYRYIGSHRICKRMQPGSLNICMVPKDLLWKKVVLPIPLSRSVICMQYK